MDGNWEGVQSVAVLMDGTVKAYDVTPTTADPTSATLTSTDPYYWTNHNDITVTAWWPYTAGETTPPAVKVKANQSTQKDFEGSDLIVADGQTVTYGSPTLRFTHRTARVTIVLTDYTEGLASVQLTGLSTEGDNPDIIVPYDKGSNTYTAIVAPQSVAAGTTFIVCTFTNGKTFVYKMKNATDWQAGGEYTYTVSLAAAKDLGYTIESNGSYTVTSADGLMNVAKLVNGGKTDINITLDKNIDLTGKDWTPIGTDYDNSYKGTFELTGIAPAPRGVPQIEVTFDIDANGIVHVSAKDKGTGKEQSMTITGGSGLPKDEIDRMVKEAEAHEAEDKKRKEDAETRNQAESFAYQTEKLVNDNKDKLSDDVAKEVTDKVNELKEALKGEDIEKIKSAQTELMTSAQKIGQALYAQQGAADAAGAAGAAGSASNGSDDDVVDAEVVDDDKDNK